METGSQLHCQICACPPAESRPLTWAVGPQEAVEDMKPGAGREAAGGESVPGKGLVLRVEFSSAAGSPPALAYRYSLGNHSATADSPPRLGVPEGKDRGPYLSWVLQGRARHGVNGRQMGSFTEHALCSEAGIYRCIRDDPAFG